LAMREVSRIVLAMRWSGRSALRIAMLCRERCSLFCT
jgi:hypothetical protein